MVQLKYKLIICLLCMPLVTSAANPFSGETLYVDPDSTAAQQVEEWPALAILAETSTATWFGDWYTNTRSAVTAYVTAAHQADALPVLVAYNFPNRDCGNYSSGGTEDSAAYLTWVRSVARGIGQRKAVVILEPDATSLRCLGKQRFALLKRSVRILTKRPHLAVYIDAGHPQWIKPKRMARRLKRSGIGLANGFSVNVSNFYTTAENIQYGRAISRRVGGKHFVIDTGRNGNGSDGTWCNPPNRQIGDLPTVDTGYRLVDALLWIKHPGESDGECNGGPAAGEWWSEYALELVEG